MSQWGRFSLFWRKWMQFIEKLKCWSVFPLWIKKWHLLCHINYCKKVLVNKKYWSPSHMHGLVTQEIKLTGAASASSAQVIYATRVWRKTTKNYLGREQSGREPSNFEYKETMIHEIFVYNILWKKLVNQKKRFFFSDLWQDHLINDFVEKLIEI